MSERFRVTQVAFSPCGRFFALSLGNPFIRIFDVVEGKIACTINTMPSRESSSALLDQFRHGEGRRCSALLIDGGGLEKERDGVENGWLLPVCFAGLSDGSVLIRRCLGKSSASLRQNTTEEIGGDDVELVARGPRGRYDCPIGALAYVNQCSLERREMRSKEAILCAAIENGPVAIFRRGRDVLRSAQSSAAKRAWDTVALIECPFSPSSLAVQRLWFPPPNTANASTRLMLLFVGTEAEIHFVSLSDEQSGGVSHGHARRDVGAATEGECVSSTKTATLVRWPIAVGPQGAIHGRSVAFFAAPAAVLLGSLAEGTLRVYDTKTWVADIASSGSPRRGGKASASPNRTPRCTRVLRCTQRLLHVHVSSESSVDAEALVAEIEATQSVAVAATTVVGEVFVWIWVHGSSSATEELSTATEPPTYRIVSAIAEGRLRVAMLSSALSRPRNRDACDSSAFEIAGMKLIVVRGTFATPRFESYDAASLPQPSLRPSEPSKRTNAVRPADGDSVVRLPLSTDAVGADRYGLEKTPLEDVRLQLAVANDAALATATGGLPSSAFGTAALPWWLPHATSVEALPRPNVSRRDADRGHLHGDRRSPKKDTESSLGDALYGVLAPLYQALHADDGSAVMTLLDAAARSSAAMATTASTMEWRYMLKLMRILASRVQCGDTPFSLTHRWIHSLLKFRAREIRRRSLRVFGEPKWFERGNTERFGAESEEPRQSGEGVAEKRLKAAEEDKASVNGVDASVPSDVIEPILQHYRGVTALKDGLAVLLGRLRHARIQMEEAAAQKALRDHHAFSVFSSCDKKADARKDLSFQGARRSFEEDGDVMVTLGASVVSISHIGDHVERSKRQRRKRRRRRDARTSHFSNVRTAKRQPLLQDESGDTSSSSSSLSPARSEAEEPKDQRSAERTFQPMAESEEATSTGSLEDEEASTESSNHSDRSAPSDHGGVLDAVDTDEDDDGENALDDLLEADVGV